MAAWGKTLLLPPLLSLCCLAFAHADPLPRVVIIIDDVGNDLRMGQAAAALPAPIDLAVLPHTPHARELAALAYRRGHEIMLHLPMSNRAQRPLGPGALTAAMGRNSLTATLDDDLAAVPHVRGVNNHMGSELTGQRRPMAWLMQVLKTRGLFFVDSRTSADTVAEQQAAVYGVPHLRRHVFLDNTREPGAIRTQFEKLLRKARTDGIAVGIGHPYPVTLRVLQSALPALLLRGIRLVPASAAIGAQADAFAQLPRYDRSRSWFSGRNTDPIATLMRH
jgi:polysaccharide deacetylase 2 family uncharacterized protein YibQ